MRREASENSPVFELAFVLVRLDHVASLSANANLAGAKKRDCKAGLLRLQPREAKPEVWGRGGGLLFGRVAGI